MEHLTYFDAVDHKALLRAFPVGKKFLEDRTRMSRDELRALQDVQFRSCMKRGW